MASPLVEAHIEAQRRLRVMIARFVGTTWAGLPAHDRVNVDEFLSTVVPAVTAGQRASVSLTDSYLAQFLNSRPAGVDPDLLVGAAVRNGTAPEEVYTRPFVQLWSALKAGTAFTDAVSAAGARAEGSAAMDMQLSMRATLGAAQATVERIRGYQRVADGRACDFCQAVDGAFVKDGDALPLHTWCGCSVMPLFDSVRTSKTPPGVAVRDHGELGPMLVDPADHFTGPSAVH